MNKRLKDPSISEAAFAKRMKNVELEKNDILAMIIAGFVVCIPVVLGVIGVVIFVSWLVFGRGL